MFGKKSDGEKSKTPKIWRRQKTAREADPYGFKSLRRNEERAKILRGNW